MSRARDTANFNPTLFAADEISGDKVSGGTIGAGTWEGTDVAVAHGGTGASTHTANNVLVGAGTSAITSVAPGADGQVLTSTGSVWQSEAAAGGTTGIDDNADAVAITIDSSENATFEKDVTVGNGSAGATVLKVLGGEAGTAEVNLFPNQADDNPDKWKIIGNTDGSLQVSTYNSGAYLPGITLQPDSSVNGAHTILGEFQSGRTFSTVNLQVNDVQNNAPIIALVAQSASPNGGSRNWCIRSNAHVYGDLCFMVSADNVTTQTSTQTIQFTAAGAANKSSGSGDWGATSDERIKEEITILDTSECLSVINQMTPKKFRWKNPDLHPTPKDDDGFSYGFIAQDLENIDLMKQYVYESEHINADDNPDCNYVPDGILKGTNIGGDKAFYIGAMQELSAKNDALEAENTALKTRMDALEVRVLALEG